MKKENNSKREFYLQKLNKNQSNSQKNPLKFLAFYVGRSKNRKQHVGGCKKYFCFHNLNWFLMQLSGRAATMQCERVGSSPTMRFNFKYL